MKTLTFILAAVSSTSFAQIRPIAAQPLHFQVPSTKKSPTLKVTSHLNRRVIQNKISELRQDAMDRRQSLPKKVDWILLAYDLSMPEKELSKVDVSKIVDRFVSDCSILANKVAMATVKKTSPNYAFMRELEELQYTIALYDGPSGLGSYNVKPEISYKGMKPFRGNTERRQAVTIDLKSSQRYIEKILTAHKRQTGELLPKINGAKDSGAESGKKSETKQ